MSENTMKNSTNSVVSIILAVCVVVLFILHFTAGKGTKNGGMATSAVGMSDSLAASMPIAYINLDSVFIHYNYSKDMQDNLMQKAESYQATINERGRALEADMKEFQRKVENNAFFDQERAVREQERVLKKQQEFQELSQKLNNDMLMEQNKVNAALRDTIMSQVRTYNAEYGHYQIILSNSMNDNVLYAEKAYDITLAVIEYLNSQYKPAKKD